MNGFFDGYDTDSEMRDLLRTQAKSKAQFCLATGVSPDQYDNLTQIEIQEFIKEANRRAKK